MHAGPVLTKSGPVLTDGLPPLRAVRLAKGFSLRKTAALAEVDPGHLSKVERGEKQFSIDALHRVAVALELREFAQMLALYLPEQDRAQ